MGFKSVLSLLSNAAATGATVVVTAGGSYSFAVLGTFSGATVALQIMGPDGATWITIPNSGQTAAGVVTVDIPTGASVRASVTGGPPTGIYASLSMIRG